ncbi:MAG: anion permease, partial [Parasporobacterium sp.]|nr:anion permease [Parasporobacterium sp.]
MNAGLIAIIIVVIVIILYATNLIPYAITSIAACVVMIVLDIVPFSTAFAGFASDTIMLVVGMMIVGNALFETGAASLLGGALTKICGRSEKTFLIVVLSFSFVMTAFCSNTATIALVMPIIAAAAKNNSNIKKKHGYMAAGFAAVGGGCLTLVGSTPQLVAQGILESSGERTIGLFDMTGFSLPRVIVFLLFYATIGYSLQKKYFDFDDVEDSAAASEAENKYGWKAYLSLGILALCIIGFVTQVVSLGTTALIGAILCVITKCVNWNTAVKKLDWNTIILLGGAIGIASGLDKSGGGEMIADFALGLFGSDISFFAIVAVFSVLANILANIMSHTATVSILVPVALSMTSALGYDGTIVALSF